jgi:hypothetical protein
MCYRFVILPSPENQSFILQGALDIYIKYIAEAASSIDKTCLEMSYSIKRLSNEEAKEVLEDNLTAVVDVKALRNYISHKLGKRSCLLFMAGGVLVKIAPWNRSVV